jgi:hypothetical protein
MGSKAGWSHVVRFYGMLKNSWNPTGMDRLNSHFLRPSPTGSRGVSGDGQSALVVKLGVRHSRSRLLTGSHRYHPGIIQQAQGRSAKTAVSPHHNNQSTNNNNMTSGKQQNLVKTAIGCLSYGSGIFNRKPQKGDFRTPVLAQTQIATIETWMLTRHMVVMPFSYTFVGLFDWICFPFVGSLRATSYEHRGGGILPTGGDDNRWTHITDAT